MANPAGESNDGVLKLDFDRRLMVQFRGSAVTSDAGLLAYRELDDALGLTAMAGETLADVRTGKTAATRWSAPRRRAISSRRWFVACAIPTPPARRCTCCRTAATP